MEALFALPFAYPARRISATGRYPTNAAAAIAASYNCELAEAAADVALGAVGTHMDAGLSEDALSATLMTALQRELNRPGICGGSNL